MAGFDDLLGQKDLPHTEDRDATAGTSWKWGYSIYDDDLNPVDLTTGYTGTYRITDIAGAELMSVDVAFPAPGVIHCTATAAQTEDLPAGTHIQVCYVTRTSDGAVLPVIAGNGRSKFVILPKGL